MSEQANTGLDQIPYPYVKGIMQLASSGGLAGYRYAQLFEYFSGLNYGEMWAMEQANHSKYSISLLDNVAMTMFGEQYWGEFADFRLLDLGCGGNEGFYPWLVGIAGFSGFGEVVGIDVVEQQEELDGIYTHVNYDLVRLLADGERLVDIVGGGYDVVSCMALLIDFPSNVLQETLRMRSLYGIHDMREAVKTNALSVLRPGGIAYLEYGRNEPWYFMKTDDNELIALEETREGLVIK